MADLLVGTGLVAKGGGPGSPMFMDVVPITGPDSTNGYTTGGELVNDLIKAEIGEGRTILAVVQLGHDPAFTWHTYYDLTNGKLLFFDEAEAQVVASTDLETFLAVPHLVISY